MLTRMMGTDRQTDGQTQVTTITLRPKRVRNYLRCRSSTPGPLFCYPGGSALTRPEVLSRLRGCLRSAGHKFLKCNCHSFRIGNAIDMAISGYSEMQICIAGRWTSNAYKNMSNQMLSISD